MSRAVAALVGCGVYWAFIACGSPDIEPPPQFTLVSRDGVWLALNREPTAEQPPIPQWTVGDAPILVLGGDPDDPDTSFFRITDAFRLESGTIVVAEVGNGSISLFDPTGALTRAIGQAGSGPGDVLGITWVGPMRGDSIFVMDPVLRRGTIFDSQGNLGRVQDYAFDPPDRWLISRQEDAYRPEPIGMFANGTVIGRVSFGGPVPESLPRVIRRDTIPLFIYPDEERLTRVFGTVGDTEQIVGGGQILGRTFGHFPVLAFGPDRMASGDGKPYEIRIVDDLGQLNLIIRKETDSTPVDETVLDRYLEYALSRAIPVNPEENIRRRFEEMPFPEELPAFRSMTFDVRGNLWVERYLPPYDRGVMPVTWDVFSPEGAWIATVETPPELEVMWIGNGEIIGVAIDELDVERVEVWRVER